MIGGGACPFWRSGTGVSRRVLREAAGTSELSKPEAEPRERGGAMGGEEPENKKEG